jgi:MFS family permease
MFNLHLFKIRPFFTGSFAGLLTATARGGLQFMLIIWLQGIWLPLHGYSFERTPLWAGIYMLPLTLGFLVAGPLAGYFSDRYGAKRLATSGLVVFGLSFIGMLLLPTDFNYGTFALMIFLNGVGGGLFAAPNSTAVMNSVPATARGGAAGIQASFMNTGMVLSMGLFFSLMIIGLSHSLPASLLNGLSSHGVSSAQAHSIAALPPVATLFSSFLGYNPVHMLLGSQAQANVTTAQWGVLTGKSFFPSLLTTPFHHGLIIVFGTAALMTIVAIAFSWLRGEHFVHSE